MDGVFQIIGSPRQDLQDAVQGRIRLPPFEADGQRALRPRYRVGYVGLGGDSVKCRPPGVPSRQRPEGGQEAVNAGVAAVSFVERPLAGRR